jgi:single-stranded-DNA-specific exonuclease
MNKSAIHHNIDGIDTSILAQNQTKPRHTVHALKTVLKRINLKEQNLQLAETIIEQHGLLPVTARILAARGLTPGDPLEEFLSPSLKNGLPEPEKLSGLHAACTLISHHIAKKMPIAITCDFDVDGLTAGAQMFDILKKAGATTHIFVPDRFKEGYGLNNQIIDEAAALNCSLLITLDFGTSNNTELEYAKSLGMRTIVVDHHHVDKDHQPVDVFINPNQSCCGFGDRILCAAGLTWYVIANLRPYLSDIYQYDPRSYLDLAAIGTICDMVPLKGVNRTLAKKGLMLLDKLNRPGLQALLEVAGVKAPVKAFDVSFKIGPRINAAGRMLHGGIVIELLTTNDQTRAQEIAYQLNDLNADRQREEKRVLDHAIHSVSADTNSSSALIHLPAAFVVHDPSYHTGVVGIVAQRLVEKFHRPAAVIGVDEGGIFKGSVRSITGISVMTILEACAPCLIKFGGHEGAGGFSLHKENLVSFTDIFCQTSQSLLNSTNAKPSIEADAETTLAELSFDLVYELNKLDPCGIGNKAPILLIKNTVIRNVICLKDAHLKFQLHDGKNMIDTIMWKCNEHPYVIHNNLVNVALRIKTNAWRGNMALQAQAIAIEMASTE